MQFKNKISNLWNKFLDSIIFNRKKKRMDRELRLLRYENNLILRVNEEVDNKKLMEVKNE